MLAARRSTAFLRASARQTNALAASPARRSASSSTTEQLKQKAVKNQRALLGAGGALVGILAVTAYVSGSPTEKRRKALARIDRVRAAPATPSLVAEKASQAKSSSPAIDAGADSPSSDDDADTSQQAAFDPETGTINWDCPCLGGMAHGTCGEEFKAAFSCFVFSEVEPKGMDCVDKFQAMQTCFREHPKEYEQVINDDEALEAEVAAEPGDADKVSMRRAQSEGRGTGGVGPLDTIKADAAIVKDKAAGVVDNVREAVAGGGNKGAPTPKTRNDGDKPLRQPAPKDGEHKPKSSSAGGAGGNPASGMSESANPMAGDHGSDSQFAGGGVDKGKDSLHPEKTTNTTGGQKDPLGRNAASGDKPSGSSKAHDKHKEGVEKTRTGQATENSKDRNVNRG